jgi:hypothetical protein
MKLTYAEDSEVGSVDGRIILKCISVCWGSSVSIVSDCRLDEQ